MQNMIRPFAIIAFALAPVWVPVPAPADEPTITPVVTGLDTPWALDFLPDASILVTERDGRLLRVADGRAKRVSGVPEVVARGQGGLLDVMVPRDFARSREVFPFHTGSVAGLEPPWPRVG